MSNFAIDYLQWNSVLTEHCLLSAGSGSKVRLVISPSILAAAWNEQHSEYLTVEEAEDSFVSAVSGVYLRDVCRSGLGILSQFDGDLPCSVAFLSSSVLAAFNMESDERYAAHDYYARLAQLLHCGFNSDCPEGFDKDEFKRLWSEVRRWLLDTHEITLEIDALDSGSRHVVNRPISQAPLRRIDLAKMPDFFTERNYQPGSRVSFNLLCRDLDHWVAARLTLQGQRALADQNRRAQVLAQVAQELEAWDGAIVDNSSGLRSAPVELQIELSIRGPKLFYLPRRPRGFPEVFETVSRDRRFESCEEGWYDSELVPAKDGGILTDGFIWAALANNGDFSLRRGQSSVIAFAPNTFGLVSRQHLLCGVKCAVLCRDYLVGDVAEYLRRITDQNIIPARNASLPEGWMLFSNFVPLRQLREMSPVLEPIDVESGATIIAVGGLRVGRRKWIVGGQPEIFVSGDRAKHEIPAVDGEKVETDAQGRLTDNGKLGIPGTHVITAGRAHPLTIEIIHPDVYPDLADACTNDSREENLVVLPAGLWAVIGVEYHEMIQLKPEFSNGIVTRVPFRPVWAIRRNSAVEPKVVCLRLPPAVRPNDLLAPARLQMAMAWAQIILSTGSSFPSIGCAFEAQGVQLRKAWKTYIIAAQRIFNSSRFTLRRWG